MKCFLWALIVGLCLPGLANAGDYFLNEVFHPGPGLGKGDPIWIPTQADPKFDFWYATSPKTWVWQGDQELTGETNYDELPMHSSGKGKPSWLLRNLGDDGKLNLSKSLQEVDFRADVAMKWGGDSDPNLLYCVAVVSESGKGYAAEFGRSGRVTIFRVDHSLSDRESWKALGSGFSGAGNGQIIALKVQNGTVKAGSSVLGDFFLSVDDATYPSFSRVALSDVVSDGVFTSVYEIVVYGRAKDE